MQVLTSIAALLLTMGLAKSQFITFKDGKIGVNFAGFHADAGLGGLLTGDRAHGGLSASAGTPWGQRAAAGLNGGLEDGAWGGLYAGAEADPNVGATAALGGSTRGFGYGASEAHAFGKNYGAVMGHNNVRGEDYGGAHAGPATSAPSPAEYSQQPPEYTNVIQKVKPPKKYSLIAAEPLHKSHFVAPPLAATTAAARPLNDSRRISTVARPRVSASDRPQPPADVGSLLVIVKAPQRSQRRRLRDRHESRRHRLTRPHQSDPQPQHEQEQELAQKQHQQQQRQERLRKEEQRRAEQLLKQRQQREEERRQQHSSKQQPNDGHAERNANDEHSYYVAKMLEKRAGGAQAVYDREYEPAEKPRRGLQLARGILGTISDALGH